MDKEESANYLQMLWTGLAVLLIPVFVWVYWVAEKSKGIHDVVAIDHALVAQSIVAGEGMSSRVVTPLHVRLENGFDRADPIFAKPALALWEALWFQLIEPSRNTVIISSGVFFVMTAWLVFCLAARFHTRMTAWICFFVFVLNPYVLDLSTCGRPEPLGMLLAGLLFWLLSNDPPTPWAYWIPWTTCFWSGLVAGILMQCVHYLSFPILLLLPLYWFRWSYRSSVETPSGTGSGGLGVRMVAETYPAGPLGMRLLFLSLLGAVLPSMAVYMGRLFVDGPAPVPVDRFLLTVNSSVALGWSFWREYSIVEPSAMTFLSMYTPSVIVQCVAGLAYGFTSIFDVYQPVVCALFILALFFPEHGETHGYRWLLLLLISLHILGMAPFYWDSRFLAVWTPIVIVTGVGTFSEFLQQRYLLQQRSRIATPRSSLEHFKDELLLYYTPMLLMLVFTSGMLFFRIWDRTPPARLVSSNSMNIMRENPARYEIIVTPAPWMVAWDTGARAMWMPEEEGYMKQLESKHGRRMQTVYLPRNRAEILHEHIPSWWFFALQQPSMLPEYQLADFSGFGEAVYLRKKSAAEE